MSRRPRKSLFRTKSYHHMLQPPVRPLLNGLRSGLRSRPLRRSPDAPLSANALLIQVRSRPIVFSAPHSSFAILLD